MESKIHVVDTVEGTLDSYDVKDFCRLWQDQEIIDTHRNHYQYKFYTDYDKAKRLKDFYAKNKEG